MNSATCTGIKHSRIAVVLFFLLCLSFIPFSPGGFIGVAGATVTASPSSIDFGPRRIGGQYERNITFSNNATAETVTLSGDPGVFSFDGNGPTVTVPAATSITVKVVFKPEKEKEYGARINGTGLNASVSGKGYFDIIDIIDVRESSTVAFGPCRIGERKTVTLHLVNTGETNVKILKVIPDLSGNTENQIFSISTVAGGSSPLGRTINAHDVLELIVTFAPKEIRNYSIKVQFLYNKFVKTSEISLSGSGVSSASGIISVASRLDFGRVIVGRKKTASLMFFNNSGYKVKISAVDLPYGSVFNSGNLVGKEIPAYGVYEAKVTFTPKSQQDFIETMRVLYEGGGVPESEISLRGTGTADPEMEVSPGVLEFGTVGVGQEKSQVLVLSNTGDVDINILKADTGSKMFKVSSRLEGTLKVGETKVGAVTFAPTAVGMAKAVLDLAIDNLPNKRIPLSGTGARILIEPSELSFVGSAVGKTSVKELVLTNWSNQDLKVGEVLTRTSEFKVTGISTGDTIPAGGSKRCFISFLPETAGYFKDSLYLNIGTERLVVPLSGVPYVDFTFTEYSTFTADNDYRLGISAASPQTGRLYVLLSHDPLSNGVIYALMPDGSMRPFPYQSPDAWQGLWYQPSTTIQNNLDLSHIDLRQLGCTQCQGPSGSQGQAASLFGGIIPIHRHPDVKNYNNASDLKYMGGTLYLGTFVKDPLASQGKPFAFDQGLLEFQILHINSLAGSWQVTSTYYGADRVHPYPLVVKEKNGNISASWRPYPPLQTSYMRNEPAYQINFKIGAYEYTYKINQLSENQFRGSYSCNYGGQQVAVDQPVCGVRVGSGVVCPPMNVKPESENSEPTESKETVVASFSGSGSRFTQSFKTDGPWEVRWDVVDDGIIIYLYGADGEIIGNVASQPDPGKGSSHQAKSGEYYLHVISDGNWKLDIVSDKTE